MPKNINGSQLTLKNAMQDKTNAHFQTQGDFVNNGNIVTAFEKLKTTSKPAAHAGEQVEITLILINDSDYDITDIKITDHFGSGVSFEENSLAIDGEIKTNLNPKLGFELGKPIESGGGTVVVSYWIQVAAPVTRQEVEFYSIVEYSIAGTKFSEKSTTAKLNLVEDIVQILKTANKQTLASGDEVEITDIIKNKADTVCTEMVITSLALEGTQIVANSVKINNQPYAGDVGSGLTLPDLNAGEEMEIKYIVRVE